LPFVQLPLVGYGNAELVVDVVTASIGKDEVVVLEDVKLQSNQMEFESLKFDQLPFPPEGYANVELVVT
jgi:hypothetical protein